VVRYERQRPGELIHIDVKKLGRILQPGHRMTGDRRSRRKTGRGATRKSVAGWEFVHIAIDDATRLAYVELLTDEKATTATEFLGRAIAFFASYGITVETVMTDNGGCYNHRRRHSALSRQTPVQRLTNLLGSYN